MSEYDGPERRIQPHPRPDDCSRCESYAVQFRADENLIKENRICVTAIKEEMKTKVPMKLFYTSIGLVVVILGVQWGTYLKINEMALDHERQMGEINVTITEVKAEVKNGNIISNQARTAIKDALVETTKATEKKMDDIKKQIEKLDKELDR